MDLILKPFIPLEYKRVYHFEKFVERGQTFAFLSRANQRIVNSKNKYQFGLISPEGKYFWFFYGHSTCRDRAEAIRIYGLLLKHCNEKKLGEPFAFKE